MRKSIHASLNCAAVCLSMSALSFAQTTPASQAAPATRPLHRAVERDDSRGVARLIGAGADVNAKNRYGVAPISLACARGNTAIVELLLRAGADANTALPEGETCLMSAASTGNLPTVKALLVRGANVNAVEAWRGQTALMWAAAEGHGPVVDALIEAGADVNARSKAGFTPLLFAVRQGSVPAVRSLLKAKAHVNDIAKAAAISSNSTARPVSDATSALAMAVINAHFDVAGVLVEHGADPNAPDARGSILHALAWIRKPGAAGGDQAPPQASGGMSSLELAEALLKHGANPNVRIAWQEIPFDRDDGEVKSPPNIRVGRDYISLVGATPFYLAAKNGDVELMRLLVKYGADPRFPTVQNVTPLMAAAGLGTWAGETPGPLNGTPEVERLEAVKLALSLGNDINAAADFGDYPIVGDPIELFTSYPKNLEQLPKTALGDMRWSGSTALHGAATSNQQSIIRYLVENGAKLDARNKLGWTPLMVAEGGQFGATVKEFPDAAALIRKLMSERGMDPEHYSKAGAKRMAGR
ncbi:MAG TPA: ankyrin repeat domain-containing protein [Vicinamibacterales bacterium]|nr:ankyrin repeat domain-containing protein [Vicinamibacterales bacterium]